MSNVFVCVPVFTFALSFSKRIAFQEIEEKKLTVVEGEATSAEDLYRAGAHCACAWIILTDRFIEGTSASFALLSMQWSDEGVVSYIFLRRTSVRNSLLSSTAMSYLKKVNCFSKVDYEWNLCVAMKWLGEAARTKEDASVLLTVLQMKAESRSVPKFVLVSNTNAKAKILPFLDSEQDSCVAVSEPITESTLPLYNLTQAIQPSFSGKASLCVYWTHCQRSALC